MTLLAAGTRHPAAPLSGWSLTLVRSPASAGIARARRPVAPDGRERDSMEPHGESSGRGAGGRARHDGCGHTGRRAPQRAAAAGRSAPYRAVLIINGARPGHRRDRAASGRGAAVQPIRPAITQRRIGSHDRWPAVTSRAGSDRPVRYLTCGPASRDEWHPYQAVLRADRGVAGTHRERTYR